MIIRDMIDRAVLESIRRDLLTIKTLADIAKRTTLLQLKAFALLNRVSNEVGTYKRMKGLCGHFNRYVAELLIVNDYDLLKDIAPIKIAYLQLRLEAHHIVLDNEYSNYAQAFQRLAKKVGNGWWTNDDTMPAMALFGELHGLSPETMQLAYKLPTTPKDLNLVKNFSPTLTTFVKTNKQTGSFAELFQLHQMFYREVMDARFRQDKVFPHLGGKSLDAWFDEMITLAKAIDQEMAPKP